MRTFLGDFNIPWRDLAVQIREKFPDLSDEQVERGAKDRRNFNKKHLQAYIKGHQIFHFGKNEYNIPIPFVVQAKIEPPLI